MRWKFLRLAGLSLLVAYIAPGSGRAAEAGRESQAATVEWKAVGTLLEACSCSVPCPCNFGQAPSNSYCHTVYAYRLKTGHFGAIALDGLVFGGGEADKGSIGFLDSRAVGEKKAALEKLAMAVFAEGGASSGPRKFESVRINAADDAQRFHVEFGESGGFDADILFGRDRKHPIVVENNTIWPVARFVKGKTTRFDYHDSAGNRLKLDGVNANVGAFDLSGGGKMEKIDPKSTGKQLSVGR